MQKDILKLLDKKQNNYEFPTFDNEYMDISQVKFSLFFKDNKDWLMVFQVVGVGSLGVCNDIHVYGDRINHTIGDDGILQLNDGDYELFDDEGEFIPNIHSGSVKIREHHFEYQFTEEDYMNNEIEVQTIESYPRDFMRMLATNDEARNLLWWEKEEILEEFGLEGDWEVAYETEKWQHVEDEKVSENEFFQSVAAAIEQKDLTIIVNKDSNTHWKDWAEFACD
ncbi:MULTISPECIES: DUF7003 family protein [Bacillus]|uniref:Group-specific protein n=1 Tax=Bacillus wiedmannii TaxID=1890302 RepID=A0AB37YZ97_9BACI|nr:MULTISPECIES: hypothetical protein [Bacillus]MDR4939970.1 hypothetical protein [Bacillus wiedmannii]MED3315118.1 hypothetical protein [Bacillus wiedmannii]OOR29847.1 hypothetical protein BW893_03590 [Bacillus wiedmannii]PEA43030.1 hypothetical protein CON83_18010 [Bacillus wiedmannii]PEJ43098.1 hypothetical protein CN889_06010 [Bacillus wiedmannii]